MTAHDSDMSETPQSSEQASEQYRDESQSPDEAQEAIAGWRLAIIFFCLAVFLLLAFMDETIVATALVEISTEFNDFKNSLWIVLAYTLTFLGFTVLASRLADVYGRRAMLLGGSVVFTAFSFGSAFAQSMNQLIAFRALQGVGGSVMYAIGILCFPELSPIRLLPLASSIVGIVVAIAGSLGPVLGGVFTSYASWRWVFWINPPIAVPSMVVLYFSWPHDAQHGLHLVQISLSQVDLFGTALLLLFTTLFTFSIQQAGSRVYSWDSPIIITLLVVGCAGFVALLAWSWTVSRITKLKTIAEILPWQILTHRVLGAAILTTLMTGFTGLMVIVWLPVYFQLVNVLTPVSAGVHLLPSVCASAVGGAVGGLTSRSKNRTWITIVVGNSLLLIGCGLFSITPVSFDVPNILYASQVIAGFGAGVSLTVTTFLISLNAEFHDHALGQGLIAQARVIGGTLGVAMGSAVFGSKITGLAGILSPEEISILYRNPGFASTLGVQEQVAVREAFAHSFNHSLRICTYVAAASLIVSLFVWQRHPPSIAERKAEQEAAMRAARSPQEPSDSSLEAGRSREEVGEKSDGKE